jgi:hypothetical protein
MSTGRIRVIQNGARSQPLVTATADEKRVARRKPYRTPGLVYPGGVAASIPCMIIDQSVTGARLEMQPGWVNPFRGESSVNQRFTLVIRVDKMQVDCEIMRLDENTMGVRFVSVAKPLISRKN